MTPSQSRRHHSPRSNKWCVDDELLALVLQMIVSPTLNSLSRDLDLVERRFEWKATWGRLEIKIHMVGLEYLDLNTRVGGSLSENVSWKCRCSDGSLHERRGGGGVYIASTQNLTITHNLPISVGPNRETQSDRFSK